MPMLKEQDFGGGDINNKYCKYCTNEDGKLKSYEEIFNGMVNFAMKNMDISEDKAKEHVAENMAKMPAWENYI
jgi:hypothetical protein